MTVRTARANKVLLRNGSPLLKFLVNSGKSVSVLILMVRSGASRSPISMGMQKAEPELKAHIEYNVSASKSCVFRWY